MKKTYDKHTFSTLSKFLNEGTRNAERMTIRKSSRTVIKDISDTGITKFPIFCEKLMDCGMTCKQISELMIQIIGLLNLDVRTRLIKKSNKSEKNMIFTWICIQNSSQLIEYIEGFYENKKIKPKEKNININIREEINKLIDEVNSQKQANIFAEEENIIPTEEENIIPTEITSNEPLFINECTCFDPTFGLNDCEDDSYDEDVMNLEFYL